MKFLNAAIAVLFGLCLSTGAAAQAKQATAALGVDDGGLIVGANFDFVDTPTENYGAYTWLYGKDTNKGQPQLFALGAHFRGHAKVGLFDYYIAPGFGLLHHSLRETELLFGPTLSIGLAAELDKTMSLGIENSKLYSWVGEYKGIIKDSFLAIFRYNLP